MTQASPLPGKIEFSPVTMLEFYKTGRHEDLSQQFINILNHFKANTIHQIGASDKFFINSFLRTFLFIFTQPDFKVPDRFALQFVHLSRTLSNIVAISDFKNTNAFVEILYCQQNNFVQVLTLLSARNTCKIDRKALFDLHPTLASLWYLEYGSIFYSGLVDKIVLENLKEHFSFSHPGLLIDQNVQEPYFGSTYVDGKCDRLIKQHLNSSLKGLIDRILPPPRNTPNPRKIAVLSGVWRAGHSVYRNYYHYLKALRPKYHITFFELGKYGGAETSVFDEVVQISSITQAQDLARLQDNDYQMLIYPDVGMHMEGIILANRRFAPIQLCWPGHSVSTWGAVMDYFVSGVDCELPVDPEQNYSERLVLIPGMGVIHNKPTYKVKGLRNTTDKFVINCPWYCQKINYYFLQTLKKLIAASKKKIVLRMFVSVSTSRANDHLPFVTEVEKQLGAGNFEIITDMPYEQYMTMMEQGEMTIDSFHFGGCNTVSDSLWIGQPTVTWEGTKWYARIGSQMLRLVGMHECIATNEEEYLEKVLKLIHNDDYRESIRARVKAADLDSTIYSTAEGKYFLNVVDHLIENHEKLKNDPSRKAIRIPEDMSK